MTKFPATLLADWYKISHRSQEVPGIEIRYATWTPRTSRFIGVNEIVVFGHQAFVKEYLINYFYDNFFSRPLSEVTAEYARIVKHALGIAEPDVSHIAELHKLGYLPLLIKAIPEGTVVPIRTPTLTIQNTDRRFFWLPTYVETLMSCELWHAYTAATIAHEYRKLLDSAALKTVGNTDFVPFQGHDFSMRGMMGIHAGAKTGMAHLLSFVGSDTISAVINAEQYYGANVEKELVATSIPASEHSIQCAYADDMRYFDELITRVYPRGPVSIVADGYDWYGVLEKVIPVLKNKIMARDGKTILRPDSGRPDLIICGDPDGRTETERKGAVETLWDIFSGTITERGYKLLDSHIGLIYGDSITLHLAEEIVTRLEKKGFASINCVFGIGSFTYQYVTRDTFGFALKSTACVIDGREKQIFKNPKTDDGTKKSQKGKVIVLKNGDGIEYTDGHALDEEDANDLLQPIFLNGKLLREEKFSDIRKRLQEHREAETLIAA